MASWIYVFLIVHLLLIEVCMNENIYCKEAVQSVEKVSSCPTSKEEWDKAASRKNCREKALKQNCTIPEKFVYHCVINGYGNATLEVCAPERIILGHCTEFNEVGGVIQDQLLSPCSKVLPRCADYYLSPEAYKYEGCYKLVEAKTLTSTSKNVKHLPSDETIDGDETTIRLLALGISVFGIIVGLVIFCYAYRRKIIRWRRNFISRKQRMSSKDSVFSGQTYDKKDQTEVHGKEIPNVLITEIGSEENSHQQLQNKSCLSSECTNDDSKVLSESQSLTGEVYDQNTLGVSKVKRRQHSGERRE